MPPSVSPSSGTRPQIPPLPGSQPANITPAQRERIQGTMLQIATANRDHLQQRLAKPSAEFQADEVARLRQDRRSTREVADFGIAAATRFAQGDNGAFWSRIRQERVEQKRTDLAAIDEQIATVPQREPELRANVQRQLDFINQRIAALEAGPVPITQREADSYLRHFAAQDQVQAMQDQLLGVYERFQQAYQADAFVG